MNRTMLTVCVFILGMVGLTDARADLAVAELNGLTLHLSGPGLGFLADGPNGEGIAGRYGDANGTTQSYNKFWHHSFFSDSEVIHDARGGASYFVGNISSQAPSDNIDITAGRVMARASGEVEHARAILEVDVFFDIIGIPPAGSTITITPTIGDDTLIELNPPRARARLEATIEVTKFINNDPVVMASEADIETNMFDSLDLSPLTIDLSDHIVDPVIEFSLSIIADARVTQVPGPGVLSLLAIGLPCICRRAR